MRRVAGTEESSESTNLGRASQAISNVGNGFRGTFV